MASTTALHARASLAPRSHLRPLALACTLAASPTGRDQNSGFNIRGLEGNRMLMLVDGVRLPRSYTFSANFLRLFQGSQICAGQGPLTGGLSAAGAAAAGAAELAGA